MSTAAIQRIAVGTILIIASFLVGYYVGYQPEWDDDTNVGKFYYLPLIGLNDSSWEIQINCYARIPANLSLQERCQFLANDLSKLWFRGLPIKVIEIVESDTGRIAVVDLEEDTTNRWRWVGGLFEGSTGGAHTSTMLVETMLQRDFSGDWVDGVRFLHEGKPIVSDHVPRLYDLTWRIQP